MIIPLGINHSHLYINALQNGGFIVTWHSANQDGSGFGIYGEIYNADGTVRLSEFLVNSITSGDQKLPFVVSFTDNSFVVAWEDSSAGNFNVRARMFAGSGTAKATDFLVDTYTNSDQNAVFMAAFPDNSFIAVW